MILYNLKCANDHRFEGWFRNSDTFDRQAAAGAIQCPHCGDHKIGKAPMAPSIHTRKSQPVTEAPPPAETPPAPDGGTDAPPSPAQVMAILESLRKTVVDNFENVGRQFAEEARAIHDGTAERRGIYGEATVEEAKELLEDDIQILPLPTPRKLS